MIKNKFLYLLGALFFIMSCSGSDNESSSILLILSLILLIILSSIFFSSFIWALKYRNVKSEQGLIIVPEVFSEEIDKLRSAINSNLKDNNVLIKQLSSNYEESMSDYREHIALVKVLKENISKNQEILKRHEERWDIYNTKRFFSNLLKSYEITREINDGSEKSLKGQIEVIKYELETALDSAEVEEFSPPLNQRFAETEGVSDRYTEIQTEDNELVGKIAKIISPGFKINRLDADSKPIILKECVVSVYVNKNQSNE